MHCAERMLVVGAQTRTENFRALGPILTRLQDEGNPLSAGAAGDQEFGIFVGESRIGLDAEPKVLGVTFDKKLSFEKHYENLSCRRCTPG